MIPPRIRPSCQIDTRVRSIYEKINIDNHFDIDDTLPSEHSISSPTMHTYIRQHRIQPLQNTPRGRPSQVSMFDYLPQSFRDRYTNDDTTPANEDWGAKYYNKPPNTIRVWYTNPNGLGMNPTGTKSHSTFSFLFHKSQAVIVSLAETNLNWSLLQYNSRLNNRLRSFYREFYSTTSHNRHEKFVVVNQATYRTRKSGSDTSGMGRWSWVQIDGKDQHSIRIVTAYRPCRPPAQTGLTTTWDQQVRCIRRQGGNLDPRQQFDKDLKDTLQTWIDENIHIVLCIDANENVQSGPFHDMITSLELVNAHDEYGPTDLPPTHDRGSVPISGMFVSPTLVPSQVGILAHGKGVLGDHRNMFLDFEEQVFMGSEIHAIPPPQQRQLQLYDSRIVNRFNNTCYKHLLSNNIFSQVQELQAQATFPPPAGFEQKLEQIDEQIGRAINSGHKNCRKMRCGIIPFSDTFRTLRDERRIWLLILRKKIGRRISSTTIRRLDNKLNISNHLIIDFIEVKYRLKIATKKYKEFIKNARTERESFLDRLAEANALSNNKPKSKVLKRIKHDEEQRVHNAKLKVVYKKSDLQRLDRVVVTHNGHPIEINDPYRVEEELRRMNSSKYSSTNDTPMMSEPYLSSVGYLAENRSAQLVLNGSFGFHHDATQDERELISRLKRPNNVTDIPITVTQQEYRDAWRMVKEHKSSSLSGRYFGVYKAVTQDPRLLPVFTSLFNISFMSGTPYNRWSGFLNVMTLKEKNNFNVDKIRSLILGEADWNMGGRIYVNRRMLQGAENLHLIPIERYGGRKGMKATDAVLNKRLALDNIRLSKRPAVILSTDAANCYDRMVHSFISLSSQRLGLSLSILFALLRPLQEARHFIRTAYGDSTSFYGGKRQIPFQGSGQGNASSSPFWTIVSSHMIDMMRDIHICSTFTTSLTLTMMVLAMIMYVDDNDIFITSTRHDPINDIQRKAQQAITFWKDALHVTGRVVRPSKCSWVFLDFSWNGSSYRYKRKSEIPGHIELSDEDGNQIALERNEPTVALEGLGVYLQPAGSDERQVQYMSDKITQWLDQVKLSTLPQSLNFTALHSKILRSLHYPLPTTCLNKEQCQRLQVQLYSKTLPKCGISSKLPLALRYGPKRYMGLSIPSLYVDQGIQHTTELLTSYETKNTTSDQLQIATELVHLILGTSNCMFEQRALEVIERIDDTWLKTTWIYLIENGFRIEAPNIKLTPCRQNDVLIMDTINSLQIPRLDKIRLNLCRIYLKVLCISDITDAGGTQLLEGMMQGRRDVSRPSNLVWPVQGRPCEQDWELWRYHISRIFARPRSRLLPRPLGPWTAASHQTWTWWYDSVDHIAYHQQDNIFVRYTPDQQTRTRTSAIPKSVL